MTNARRLRVLAWIVAVGAGVALVVGVAARLGSPLVLTSVGASLAVIASEPAAKSAQPRTVAFSYLIAAAAGTIASIAIGANGGEIDGLETTAAAVAACVAFAAMWSQECVHPPAIGIAGALGASPLVVDDLLVFGCAFVIVTGASWIGTAGLDRLRRGGSSTSS